jgi:hypothetical protein
MARISKKRGKKSRAKTKAKNTRKRKKATRTFSSPRTEIKIDRALTDNFIALQKIMVNFSAKFDALSNQISKLLELFEISAKSLARKDLEPGRENKDTRIILEKLDSISKQAGLIGKGLALIHEISAEKTEPSIMPAGRGPPAFPMKPAQEIGGKIEGYQRSIASGTAGTSEAEKTKPKESIKEIPE